MGAQCAAQIHAGRRRCRGLDRSAGQAEVSPLSAAVVENYFNYFTEIEEHFHRRRGAALLLSTLDWALIESWKDAGIPLEAVLRGIDATFDHWGRRPSKTR